MPTIRPRPSNHPLESIVRRAFEETDCLDAPKLFPYLAGCIGFSGKRAATGNRAYMTVAEDVLSCMESQGKVSRDAQGWYRLVNP